MTRVLVTGATGFVGQMICDFLSNAGYVVRAALRGARPVPASVSEVTIVGDISLTTDWANALAGVDLVLHAAARAHVLKDTSDNSNLYLATNARATSQLAAASAQAGVRRFVYLSSVKVNGEETLGSAYTAADTPNPQDMYGESKWFGEQHLRSIADRADMEYAIARAPLVYGPGVRANFLRLMRWVDKGWPLPLGAIRNKRSLVNIWNLCDLLTNLLTHPRAPGHVWMVSDGEDISAPELITKLAHAMGRPVRLVSMPISLLEIGGRMLGESAAVGRLCGSLQVDIGCARNELNWNPPVSVDEGLARTVRWYLEDQKSRAS